MNMAETRKINLKKAGATKMSQLDKKSASALITLRVFIMAVVELFIGLTLSFLKKDAIRSAKFFNHVRPVLIYVFAAFVLAAAAYFIIAIVKELDTSVHVVTPFMLFAIAMSTAVVTAFYTLFMRATYLFWIGAVIVCVFFALFYIYTVLMYKK